jgi:hypothetical protein
MYSSKFNGDECSADGVTINNGAPLHENTVGSAILDFDKFKEGNKTDAQLYVVGSKANGTGMNKCTIINKGPVTVLKASEQNAMFLYVDSYTISPNGPGSNAGTFTLPPKDDPIYTRAKSQLSGGKLAYTNNPSGSCASFIAVDPNNPGNGMWYKYNLNSNNDCVMGYEGPQGQWITTGNPVAVTITQTENWKEKQATDPDKDKTKPSDQKPSSTSAASDKASTCEGSIPVLGWVICAITEAADNIIGFMESTVKGLLRVEPKMYGEGLGGVNKLKTAWSAIRIIATVAMVGIALFMIISQMLSLDMVSAYTVKKMVPRLVIAIIAIQLSWFLFTTLIQIVNVLGDGLQALLYAPFGGPEKINNITAILAEYYKSHAVAGATWQSFTTVGAVVGVFGLGVAIMAGAGSAIGLLLGSLAISIILAIAVVLFVLIVRLVLIISLLVIAPLALVAWIMPNTQNLWSKWWSMFFKLLLMYPLIVLMLSMGKIIAYLVAVSGI